MTEALTPSTNLRCDLCKIGLAGSLPPIDILKTHYKLTHPEIDKWPKDANGLPILKDYYKRSANAAVVNMMKQAESQPQGEEPEPAVPQVNTDSVEEPVVHPRDVATTVKAPTVPQPRVP